MLQILRYQRPQTSAQTPISTTKIIFVLIYISTNGVFSCWYPSIRGLVRWISEGVNGCCCWYRKGQKDCCCWYRNGRINLLLLISKAKKWKLEGRRKMLSNHTWKSGWAIVSEASTAQPDFQVWSGVASKRHVHVFFFSGKLTFYGIFPFF